MKSNIFRQTILFLQYSKCKHKEHIVIATVILLRDRYGTIYYDKFPNDLKRPVVRGPIKQACVQIKLYVYTYTLAAGVFKSK